MLAHGAAAASGPSLPLLISGGILLLAAAFGLIRRAIKPPLGIGLLVASLALGGGAFVLDRGSGTTQEVSLAIVDPADGAEVPADEPIDLDVELVGARISGEQGAEDLVGHLHLFVDGQLTAMPNELSPSVQLDPGPRTILVEFVDEAHRQLEPRVTAQVTVTAA